MGIVKAIAQAEFRWAISRTWDRGPQRDTRLDVKTLQQCWIIDDKRVWRDVPSVVISEDRSALKSPP